VGPNLDQAKPDIARVVSRVTKGMNAMPPFADQLSAQQIADVAAYVTKATGG
jgi:mono/diheme cytochrome c family protein